MQKSSVSFIILSGIFMALTIIFTHIFAIQTPFMRFSFGFLPIAVYAINAGSFKTAIMAGLADILGCLLFEPGLYYPGFTISSIITGLIYGYFFSRKNITLPVMGGCFLLTFLLVDLFLNTFWLTQLYHKAATVFLYGRFIKGIVLLPIHIWLFYIIYKVIIKYK
ncbi:folate family ECF transporter S component [Pectinatus brassicae]|uniref:ECF transporter S component (Folate family) n=1 Tax=Pectinatus brassicae TaxID=862415 RepID=A0A840UEC7_9FIRM|nr:folate family ECF transporter S component [Pectinatus brassicae]MBB5335466.1 ECF transporter S component (folate family) [Pectinatus brassicae]